MSDRRFFSGDSLTQAVNQAAQHFELMPAELDYKVLDKRHGFLKVRRKVVIEVSESAPRKAEAPAPAEPEVAVTPVTPAAPEVPDVQEAASESGSGFNGWSWTAVSSDEDATAEPRDEPEVAAPADEAEDTEISEPSGGADDKPTGDRAADKNESSDHFELAAVPQPAKKRYAVAEGEEAEAAAEALGKILALASLDLETEILQGEEQLEIELWGPGQKILLRDRGRLLLAIQHLLPRVVRGLIGRSVSCRVDSDNFHEIREERLRDLAQRAADDVRHKGRPKTLEPMSPDERRIVHLTLSDYPGVETESQGSGLFKRVMVRKVRQDRPRGFDPYKR